MNEELKGIERFFDRFFNVERAVKEHKARRQKEISEANEAQMSERRAWAAGGDRGKHVAALAKKHAKKGTGYHQGLKELEKEREKEKRLKAVEDEKFLKAANKAREIDEKGFQEFWQKTEYYDSLPDEAIDYVTEDSTGLNYEFDLDKLDQLEIIDSETGEPIEFPSLEDDSEQLQTIDIDSLEAPMGTFGASTGVFVRSYQRVRNGQLQTVRSYNRRNR